MSKVNALDLTKDFPRSPRTKLGGYVIAGRCIDKCRAVIAGTNGEYHYDCPLDKMWLEFAGVDADKLKEFVATGADDAAIEQWISENSAGKSKEDIIKWNNDLRYKRICEMPDDLQVFLEDYIDEVVPAGNIVYHWFDVYDIEEGRI